MKTDDLGLNKMTNKLPIQLQLSASQVEAFYDYYGNDSQSVDFLQLVPKHFLTSNNVVVDVGGGCGFFALNLQKMIDAKVRVLDMDPVSVDASRSKGLEAYVDDALKPTFRGDETIIVFNLILHHLIGSDEKSTLILQGRALNFWLDKAKMIFVNEYIYDSYFRNISGHLIYLITKNKLLSTLASFVSRFIPSLRANTFGVGVRFRGHSEWVKLFEHQGFRVVASIPGPQYSVSLPRKLLLISGCRTESFLLEPK